MPGPSPVPVLKEVVVAAWRNELRDACGLGCATPFNDQDPNLMFSVFLDEENDRIFAKLGLAVMVKGGGNRKLRGFDYLIPLYSSGPRLPVLESNTINISDIDDDSIRAAVSNARLSKSGTVIRVRFNLEQQGLVVTPWKEEPRFVACSDTSLELLSGLFSLADASEFMLYMGPSDYAQAGSRRVKNLVETGRLQKWSPELTGVYGGRTVMQVSRDQVESSRRPRPRGNDPGPANSKLDLPAYMEELPPYDPATTLVPRSPPPGLFGKIASPTNSLLAEDSCRSEQGHDHGKDTAAAGPRNDSLVRTTGKRKRSDAEQDALRQAFARRLKEWLCLAFKENERVYEHTVLQPFFDETVPSCVAACDADKFDVGISYATAVLACDPQGTCDLYWTHRDEFFKIVDDVRALIFWSMRRDASRELRSWSSFMKLGSAAMTALETGNRSTYDQIKASITADRLVEYEHASES